MSSSSEGNRIRCVSPLPHPLDNEPIEVLQPANAHATPRVLEGLLLKIRQRDIADFGKDESAGKPTPLSAVLLPKTEAQLSQILRRYHAAGRPLTIGAAHTGLCRGAVPAQAGQELLSTRGLRTLTGKGNENLAIAYRDRRARVAPGIPLEEFQEDVSAHGLLYPPDPTERSALMGGTVATNASGARSFLYGPTRRWVQGLRVVLANGEVLALRRGQCRAARGEFVLHSCEGVERRLTVGTYPMPPVKNTAGYFARPGMDLIDLFIGSEGTLGVISEIEVGLLDKPKETYTANVYFPEEKAAQAFVRTVWEDATLAPSLLEYLDRHSVAMIRERFGRIGAQAQAAIYLEFHLPPTGKDTVLDAWHRAMERHGASDIQDTTDDAGRELLRQQRHAVPERVHQRVAEAQRAHPEGVVHTVASDIAVPREAFADMMGFYEKVLAANGLPYAIWGHIGQCHVHVNMIPRDPQECARAEEILLEFAHKAKALGGTMTAEHGVGKAKIPELEILYDKAALAQMRALKQSLDPAWVLGPGTMFS